MDIVTSLPSIDHMTPGSRPVTSHIRQPSHRMTSDSKGTLPPLSVLLHPEPQPNLSEIRKETSDSMKNHHHRYSPMMSHNNTPIVHEKYIINHEEQHKQHQQHQQHQQQQQQHQQHQQHQQQQQQQPFHSHDHHPSQNNGAHPSQRTVATDNVRLPSIKHFEQITSSPPVKQTQVYPPCPPHTPQSTSMHIHSPSPPLYNTSKQPTISNDLLPQSPSHHSTMWTRISHSPKPSSQSPGATSPSSIQQSQKPSIFQSAQQPVRFVTNNYSPDYQNNGPNVEPSVPDKMTTDMQKIADHCTIISQFATQYSEFRNQTNKFGGSFPSSNHSSHWVSNPTVSNPTVPTGTSIVNLEHQVTEMISRTCEILNILNCVKSEIDQTVSNDMDTISLIRTKRTTVGPSATRTKYRKRSKRAAPPGRCHSCNISETPEWRRGPDGARTLCNACGLHFAKLTRKRALSAIQQHQQPTQVHKIPRTAPVLPSIQPIVTQPKHIPTMLMGGLHLAPPHQSTQMMQNSKRLRPDIHQMNDHPINGNYLKA